MLQAFVSNAPMLRDGAVLGAVLGGIGILFSGSMEKENRIKEFFFLDRNDDLAQPLFKLKSLLSIENNPWMLTLLPKLSKYLDVIAGCDEMTDNPSPFPLHLTYTVNEISCHIGQLLKKVIDQKFPIPALGLEVCECADQITEAVENIKFNVIQETSLRVMTIDFNASITTKR